MKTFRFIGMALLAIIMCVNFTACSDDDDEPTGSSLVGRWELTWEEGSYTDKFTGELHEYSNAEADLFYVFAEEGTGECYDGDILDLQFTWKIVGNKLYLNSTDGKDSDFFTILELNENQMKLGWEDSDNTDSWINEKGIATYTKR